jgi:hypothetical protein
LSPESLDRFIDEIDYLPIDRIGANLFFQLISRRWEKEPHAITAHPRQLLPTQGEAQSRV